MDITTNTAQPRRPRAAPVAALCLTVLGLGGVAAFAVGPMTPAAAGHHPIIECIGDARWSVGNSEADKVMTFSSPQGPSGTVGAGGSTTVTYNGDELTINASWPNGVTAGDTGYGPCTRVQETTTTDAPTTTTEAPATTTTEVTPSTESSSPSTTAPSTSSTTPTESSPPSTTASVPEPSPSSSAPSPSATPTPSPTPSPQAPPECLEGLGRDQAGNCVQSIPGTTRPFELPSTK